MRVIKTKKKKRKHIIKVEKIGILASFHGYVIFYNTFITHRNIGVQNMYIIQVST